MAQILFVPLGGGAGGGITQLTQDVTAGPGAGAQAATVVGLQGNPVSNAAPGANEVLAWDGAQWAPATGTVSIASERWVTTGGSDISGDGSLSAPYATVGAALASITTASPSSRWAVRVAAGAFTEAAPLLLKPNVFIVGEDRNATRITAPSVSLDASWAGAADDRSGFANLTLIGACTFDFAAVTSSAGKLYSNNASFNSAVSFNGFGAINQTIFFTTYFFGTFTTSGVNHGAHVSCVHSALVMNQHPSLPSIVNAVGGSAGATTLTTTVDDFNRRCSLFAKNFWMEPVTVDGLRSYLDATVSSLPSGGASLLNGGNLVWIDKGANRTLSNLQGQTAVNESLVPDTDSNRYLGDFGRQWLFTFNYVLSSTGTDLYIITTPSSYGPSSPGHAIFIQPDSYGLAAGANGGNVEVETVAATGAGNSGSIVLKTGAVAAGIRGDISIDANEANLALAGALNINTAPGAAGEVLTSNGPGVAPTWQAGGGAPSLALAAVRVATAAPLPANSYAAGVLTASSGGSINATGIDGVTTLALADRVLVKDEASGLKNQVYEITDLGSPASGPATPAVPAPPTFSGSLLTCGSGGTYATLTAAVAAAAPGDRIQILPGTITEAAAVAVNKSLEIFGTGATCIVQRNSTTSVLAVTASNVYLHDFKIVNNQLASADPGGQSACVGADTMNRTSLGGATGLYFANLTCEMPKVGIFVSGTSWVVRDCAFSPSAANTTAGTTLRAVFAYGSEGTSFINDNTFLTTLDNTRLTAIYLNTRNDGIAPNWEGGYKGSLVIDGNVINDAGGAPRSYIDATSIYHQSGAAATAPPTGEFSLYIVNNDFSLDHQSSPCVFFGRSYGATPVAPLSFFLDLVVSDNAFGAREASASQKGALFWTNTSGGAVAMGSLVGGLYGANNTIDPMVLPASNTSIMADSSLLMVRENAFYNAPSPLLTLVPLNPGSPWELTVAADFVSAAARGVFTSVNEGTANAATTWIVVTPDPIALGTTALTWDPFGAATATPDGTFYVTPGGSDLTGNGSILAPLASISFALTLAGAGEVVSVGPGTYTEAAPLAVPQDVAIIGTPETEIVAPAVTLDDGVTLENVKLTTPTITTVGTQPAGPGATVNLTRVFVTSATTVNNNGTNTAFVTTNTTFGGATTINGGPTNSVVFDYSRASSSTTINNTTSFSATASSFLSVAINNSPAVKLAASEASSLTSTNSTTTLSGSGVTGNVIVSGGSLTAGGSTIGGSLNASGAAAVNLSLDSQPQGGSTLAGGSTLTSLTIVAQNVALDGTATLSTPATIGSVYFSQARTLTAGSLGFFGGSVISDTTSLTLVPSGGGPAAATWTRTGLLGSQALTSGGSLVAGWYDIVLTPGASGTAFARGLYLV